MLNNILPDLNDGKMIHDLNINEYDLGQLKSLALLTAKPMIYVANIADTDLVDENNDHLKSLRSDLKSKGKDLLTLSGAIEMEISSMNVDEQKEFLEEYGLKESGLNKLIRYAYKTLQLETFFTAGPKEIRAWSIKKGSTAPEAAGVIHSDFQRGFIKAEVYILDDLMIYKDENEIKNAGKLRQEGKDYIVNDGDIIFFKFNV